MRRLKNKKAAIGALALALAVCLLLAALLLFPGRESLPSLQKTIVKDGSCSVAAGGDDYVIRADIALIENDTLLLKRATATGDSSLVVVHSDAGFVISAKSMSIRYIASPEERAELTIFEPDPPYEGTLCLKLRRYSRLHVWFWRLRKKMANII